MPRRIRQIEIYLRLTFNDGTPIAPGMFRGLEVELLVRYGGVPSTHRQFPLQGLWQTEGIVYRDKVVVFNVMDFSKRTHLETIRYLQNVQRRLKKEFDQREILITLQPLTAI